VTAGEVEAARRAIGEEVGQALGYAAERIEAFHRHMLPRSWWMEDRNGSLMGQQVRPLDRVGIYAPGGRAAYPSTVLMTAIPAKVAGVGEIVLVSPPSADKTLDPAVLVAGAIAGVTEAYRVGGAQAVAALAFGTETIRRVDKIVGPGNIYVALAKRQVVGQVGIDMIAGPSEVVIVADDSAEPEWVAADLLAQAEHDPMARAILLTPAAALVGAVAAALERQLVGLPRREIAREALEAHGALVLTRDLAEAVDLANSLAPEHLELQVADPFGWLTRVRNAGAIFLGRHTPEVVGDYVAGPNHVLPTGGTARVASGLGVEDFVKRSSLIHYTARGLQEAWPHLSALCGVEGLTAHGEAARRRLSQ
jgi:histidinol dehydrogenase